MTKTKEDVLKLIDQRIKYHEAQFDKYDIETRVYRNDKKQVDYSVNQAIKEMKIVDELKELKAKIKGE